MQPLVAIRLASLAALFFSSASAVDLLLPDPAFCAQGSGCDAVRHSDLGKQLGALLPGLGLGVYSLVLLGTVRSDRVLRPVALWCAVLGGLGGAVLLALQAFVIGHFCWLCLGSDGAALVAGLAAALVLKGRGTPGQAQWYVWLALYVVAVAAPPVFSQSRPSVAPGYVQSLWQPGKVTLVEFSDFECPFCRALHPKLSELVQEHGERVALVRVSYPLPGHPGALPAAAAYLCAQQQGKGEPMAHRLFEAADMGLEALQTHARELELRTDEFAGCLKDPATLQRIKSQKDSVRATGFKGLPTVWVGHTAIRGYGHKSGVTRHRDALEAALAGRTPGFGPYLWLALGASVVAILVGGRGLANRA